MNVIPTIPPDERISRQNMNNRLRRINTNLPISDSAGGANSLTSYKRIVGYSSNDGVSSVTVNLSQVPQLKEIGIYYGYSGIKRYVRMPANSYVSGVATYIPVALHYMTQGGNFVVRKGILYCSYGYTGNKVFKMLSSEDVQDTELYSYYFSTDNRVWTKDEGLLIYKVVAFSYAEVIVN